MLHSILYFCVPLCVPLIKSLSVMTKSQESIPLVQVVADFTHKLSTGDAPIRLRITYNRKRRYWTLNNLDGTPMKTNFKSNEEFQEFRNSSHKSRIIKDELSYYSDIETSARILVKEIIQEEDEFTFEAFKEKWTGKSSNKKGDLISGLDQYAKTLRKEGRISTAVSYEVAMRSVMKYSQRDELGVKEITVKWLKDYENWMLNKQKNSVTTVGIYLRCVRKVLNDEIAAGRLPVKKYPFGSRAYKIPESNNTKKALTKEQVQSILNYKCSTPSEEYFRDLWMFSYLSNGMNPKDILNLKYRAIKEDRIIYMRAKTRSSNPKEIYVVLLPQIRDIIEKWGNKNRHEDQYVFPILNDNMNPEEVYRRVQQTVKNINKYMKRIGKALEIEKPITTYTARHAFATVLKLSGESDEVIKESIGHSTVRQTQRYLASFDSDTKKRIANNLL